VDKIDDDDDDMLLPASLEAISMQQRRKSFSTHEALQFHKRKRGSAKSSATIVDLARRKSEVVNGKAA
jgi:hypothetical protein